MSINERPGVYSSVEVSSVSGGGSGVKAVGIAAAAAAGTKGKCVYIGSVGEAVSEFGAEGSMTKLIRLLLENGAADIYAVAAAVNETAEVADYEAAFAALMECESVKVMLCDSDEAEVHEAMRAAIAGAGESCKYRIGIAECGGTAVQAAAKAAALNSERMVMVYPAADGEGALCGTAAAAFAAAVAAGGDPALPLNGAELMGLENVGRLLGDSEVTSLVRGGVTPIERVGARCFVVRAVTTRSTTGGEADDTWRELTTVLIVDDVVPGIRTALRTKFPRVKNTAQTRGAIRTQVLIELEKKQRAEIIDGYGEVTAKAAEDDPCVCDVSFQFTVAHGMNRINLAAHISV